MGPTGIKTKISIQRNDTVTVEHGMKVIWVHVNGAEGE